MRRKHFFFLFCSALLILTGCEKRATTALPASNSSSDAPIDACVLITRDEVQTIAGSPITDVKSSVQTGSFRVSQCFYAATDFVKSVSLSVTQNDPDAKSTKRSPRAFWKERFGRYDDKESEAERDRERKEMGRREEDGESTPPKRIDGLGDEAFWVASSRALYVLKNDVFIRLGLGGSDSDEIKIKNSRALAVKALQRL